MAEQSVSRTIPFVDLQAQRQRLGADLDAALARVIDQGAYILGPEVADFEHALASYAGVKHCLTCANGTDAIALGLMAAGIGEGDAVFVPAFTFAATAEAVAWLGATPIFVDVLPDTFNMDADSLERAVGAAASHGLKPRAVIPVDLFGQPADYRRLAPLSEQHDLFMLADAAQSFGAMLDNRRVGRFGRMATTSFYPAKPLGCYGDGGAIFTDDDGLADLIRSLRQHGEGTDKFDNLRIGLNSRLDTLQAAVLLQKLSIFDDELSARQRLADQYSRGLADCAIVPHLMDGATSSWAQYTLILPDRDAVARRLKADGIPTGIYYPRPLHWQPAYRHYPVAPGGTPVAERLAQQVLSLPMHAYLSDTDAERITNALRRALARAA